MDETQVHRVSNALKESAAAIQGINAKFDVIDAHWRSVQQFNSKINQKVEGTLGSFERLDTTFNSRVNTVLDHVVSATGDLTKGIEDLLDVFESFDLDRQVHQIPKAMIPLVLPLIVLLIEVAVANAFLGMLLVASLPEVGHKYSNYLLFNASSVLLGLMLSLLWLGIYRVHLSYKARHRKGGLRKHEESAGNDEAASCDQQNRPSEFSRKISDPGGLTPNQVDLYARNSKSEPCLADVDIERYDSDLSERLRGRRASRMRRQLSGSGYVGPSGMAGRNSPAASAVALRRHSAGANPFREGGFLPTSPGGDSATAQQEPNQSLLLSALDLAQGGAAAGKTLILAVPQLDPGNADKHPRPPPASPDLPASEARHMIAPAALSSLLPMKEPAQATSTAQQTGEGSWQELLQVNYTWRGRSTPTSGVSSLHQGQPVEELEQRSSKSMSSAPRSPSKNKELVRETSYKQGGKERSATL